MTDTLLTPAPAGLRGLAVADTTLGDVRGDEGFYHYRQYSAVELAARRSFEDVAALLLDGDLPDASTAGRFRAELAAARGLPPAVAELLPLLASGGTPPLVGLRTALSHLAAVEGFRPIHDIGRDELRAQLVRLVAVTPTIVAALHRLGRGEPAIEPDPTLGVAADYLRMVTGETPSEAAAGGLERYLVLAVDHGFNASTFTARVVASTGTDAGGAVVAALSALAGPRHGGAPARVLDMLDAIGDAATAPGWVRDQVAGGNLIMGFGHTVYRGADPRSVALRGIAEQLAATPEQHRRVALAAAVESAVEATLAELKGGRVLRANVEYWAAIVMELCGLPRALCTPTFAVARVAGWAAQVLEQAADPRVIRPAARYVGPPPPQPVPPAV